MTESARSEASKLPFSAWMDSNETPETRISEAGTSEAGTSEAVTLLDSRLAASFPRRRSRVADAFARMR